MTFAQVYTDQWNLMLMCISKNPSDYRFKIKILGLCVASSLDREYVFERRSGYHYIGQTNSTLEYFDGSIWHLKNNHQTVEITASQNSLSLGTFEVNIIADNCTQNDEDRIRRITITHCSNKQFTCFSGECVTMD